MLAFNSECIAEVHLSQANEVLLVAGEFPSVYLVCALAFVTSLMQFLGINFFFVLFLCRRLLSNEFNVFVLYQNESKIPLCSALHIQWNLLIQNRRKIHCKHGG